MSMAPIHTYFQDQYDDASSLVVRRKDTSGTCLAAGCHAVLANLSKYCQQRHLCPAHLKASSLRRKDYGDQLWRFCQQCGKLETVSAFDGDKRSCRVRLARRRAASFKLPSATSSTELGMLPPNLLSDTAGSQDQGGRPGMRRAVSHAALDQLSQQQQQQQQQLYEQQQYEQQQLLDPQLEAVLQQQQLLLQHQMLQQTALQQQVQQLRAGGGSDSPLQGRLSAVQAQLASVQQELALLHKRQQAEAELLALQQQYEQLDVQLRQHQQLQLLERRASAAPSPSLSNSCTLVSGPVAALSTPLPLAPLAPASATLPRPAAGLGPEGAVCAGKSVRFSIPAGLQQHHSLPAGAAAAGTAAFPYTEPLPPLGLAAQGCGSAASAPLHHVPGGYGAAANGVGAGGPAAGFAAAPMGAAASLHALVNNLHESPWEEVLLQDMEEDEALNRLLAAGVQLGPSAARHGSGGGAAAHSSGSTDTSSGSSCSNPTTTGDNGWLCGPPQQHQQPQGPQPPVPSPFALAAMPQAAPSAAPAPAACLPGCGPGFASLSAGLPGGGHNAWGASSGAAALDGMGAGLGAGGPQLAAQGVVSGGGRRSMDDLTGILEAALLQAGARSQRACSDPTSSAAAAAAAFDNEAGACFMQM